MSALSVSVSVMLLLLAVTAARAAVALLHHGRLARLGPPGDVITSESLRDVHGVEVNVLEMTRPDGRTAHVCVPALGRGSG